MDEVTDQISRGVGCLRFEVQTALHNLIYLAEAERCAQATREPVDVAGLARPCVGGE